MVLMDTRRALVAVTPLLGAVSFPVAVPLVMKHLGIPAAGLTAMALGHMLDDGQAQPGATGLTRAAAIHAVKALSQARQMFRRNALTRIAHAELGPSAIHHAPTHLDRTAMGRVADRIGH